MYLNHLGKQVTLRMFSNLLANVFLAEIAFMIEVLVCFVYNVLLYHFVPLFACLLFFCIIVTKLEIEIEIEI